MNVTHRKGALTAMLLIAACAMDSHCATLSAAPLPRVIAGETHLARPASLGMPLGSVWAVNSLYWNAAKEIEVEVAVSDAPSPTDTALVFFTVGNIEAGAWSGLEIDLSGPAEFITTAPISSTLAFNSIHKTENQIAFAGMDWQEGTEVQPITTSLDFSLILEPTGPNESIVLTFRPIAVPEPTSGLLLAAGALTAARRRRKMW